ncbi:PREDICTED: 17-beta-hydroxysteroid dehydrogenase 13-like, partial [Ficedula albicollis]|uniref:17-beta-hydroxysteroid dehydrogenase 13-like n=1 Tax=Ficedula albicollis TaxID=59894 RepID=UPI0007AD8A74
PCTVLGLGSGCSIQGHLQPLLLSCARCFSLCLLQHGVEETAAECQKLGATVQTFVVDCSKREEIYSTADKVKKDIGDVTILVNNVGIITAADFLSTQDHQIEKMFEVNILGHMWVRATTF